MVRQVILLVLHASAGREERRQVSVGMGLYCGLHRQKTKEDVPAAVASPRVANSYGAEYRTPAYFQYHSHKRQGNSEEFFNKMSLEFKICA